MPHLLPQHGRMTKRSPLQAVGELITGQHPVLHLLQRGPANSLPHPLFILPRHGDALRLPPAPSPGLKGVSLQTWFPKEACTLPAGFGAGDTLGTPGGGRGVQEGSTFCRTGPPHGWAVPKHSCRKVTPVLKNCSGAFLDKKLLLCYSTCPLNDTFCLIFQNHSRNNKALSLTVYCSC